MRIGKTGISCVLIGTLALLTVSASAAESERIQELIRSLSSESYQAREQAAQDLWKLGDQALEELLNATLSDDPEMAFRAAEVLRNVELRTTPETPDVILSLIRSYQDAATLRQKSDLLESLKAEKAYYQCLKLYSMEPREIQKRLSEKIGNVAILGARQAIVEDDLNTATELLRLSCVSGDHKDLMALACLYETTGQIDEQLTQLNPPHHVSEVIWKSVLLRAKGDLDGAIAHAEEHGQERILAGLKILKGDPTLWLEHNGWNEPDRQAHPAYIDIALKRWNGERVGKADFEPLRSDKGLGDGAERDLAISALTALGEFETVEQIQASEFPSSAFIYHLAKDEVGEALVAFGLDPEKPDYAAWVSGRFERMQALDADGNDALELIMMAGFMERRGLHDELESAFAKPMKNLQEKDEEVFLRLFSSLFDPGNSATTFGINQAVAWAGDDAGRWDRVFEMVLEDFDQELVVDWLDWIREIKPEMSRRETFEVMLTLFGANYRPGDLRFQWMDTIWEVIGKTDEEALKNLYLKRVISLSIELEDVSNAIKAWDLLEAEARESEKWSSIDRYLSAMGRWQEVADIIESSAKVSKSPSPEIHAYYAAVLRRIGREEDARLHEELAEKLNFGSVSSAIYIGNDYVFCGDEKRASEWFRQAALQANISHIEFLSAIARNAEYALNLEDWSLAAACNEVLAHYYASEEDANVVLLESAKSRMNADLAHAISILGQRREDALALLEGVHENFLTDASLADHFFPALKQAGLNDERSEWFAESWERLVAVIEKYPECHNSRNSAAWLASRAELKLKEAKDYLKGALEASPEQPAYLDTMAELNFAQGNRDSAIQWSDQAVRCSPFEAMIRMQNFRFKNQK